MFILSLYFYHLIHILMFVLILYHVSIVYRNNLYNQDALIICINRMHLRMSIIEKKIVKEDGMIGIEKMVEFGLELVDLWDSRQDWRLEIKMYGCFVYECTSIYILYDLYFGNY